MGLRNAELARELNVTPGRVSQWVSEGKLEGCYAGSGRARRFDLDKCREALRRKLDAGQQLGNGAATRKAIREGRPAALDLEPEADEAALDPPADPAPPRDGALADRDPDRYELARTLLAEENARAARRKNLVEEGAFLLRAEVELETRRLMAREVSRFETVLKDGARAIADRMGVDFRTARAILLETWRDYRADRTGEVREEADGARLTDAEKAANV